jgi:hypothetical protein
VKNMYDDIIGLPHHVSPVHPQMARADRAAQFSPFAALTGYEMVIHEAGRMTDQQIELDEDARNMLDEKLKTILKQTGNRREAKITFFQPDAKKEGGIYVTATGLVKEIDTYHRAVVMMEGKRIPLEHIVEVETNPSF